jgi:hypothetical protein
VSLSLLAGCLALADAASAIARTHTAKHRKLSAAERAHLRKTLLRQLRKQPSLALSRTFLKKAQLAEMHVPLSVRLSKSNGAGGYEPSDDLIQITWDDSAFAWPLTAGTLAAPQTVLVGGNFTMEGIFGGGETSGYGELGTTETVVGGAINMHSDPFTVSEFATPCPDGPQLTTDPANQVVITSAGARFGIMNLFSGSFRGTLSLRMAFRGKIAASCGATPALTPAVDNSTAPPIPLRLDGKMSISPGITGDGKMRFAKITIDDAVVPQLSSFAFIRSCTGTVTCDPQSFPARVKVEKVTAELLLGDVLA